MDINTQTPKKKGITSSTLKIIAITLMFIDHIGAGLIEGRMTQILAMGDAAYELNSVSIGMLFTADAICRGLGRVAFPIFCFLLVEGLSRTRNPLKYALRMGLFAFVSEIPFDLAFRGVIFDWGYQNVFFTLFFGLMVIYLMQRIDIKLAGNTVLRLIMTALTIFAGAGAVIFLKTDYSAFGVLTIIIMYMFRKNKLYEVFSGCICLIFMSLNELPCLLSIIPIKYYNGEKGLKLKYFFYIFYPAHLLVIYAVRLLLGIQ